MCVEKTVLLIAVVFTILDSSTCYATPVIKTAHCDQI